MVLLCDPCNGRITCRCRELSRGEYQGRAREYKGDPEEYVCPQCAGFDHAYLGIDGPLEDGSVLKCEICDKSMTIRFIM